MTWEAVWRPWSCTPLARAFLQLTSVRLFGWTIKFWQRRHSTTNPITPAFSHTHIDARYSNKLTISEKPRLELAGLLTMRALPVTGLLHHHYQCTHRVREQQLGHLESLLKAHYFDPRSGHALHRDGRPWLDMADGNCLSRAPRRSPDGLLFGFVWRNTPGSSMSPSD